MKKILILACLIASIGMMQKANGQAQVAVGIKGGLNFAKVDESGANNKTGINAGAFALIKLSKIGIQPEVLFSRQGFTAPSSIGDFKSSINYVNIPVILKLYTVAGINLQVGPQFGFVTSAKGEFPVTSGSSTMDIKDSFKSSDLSLALGLGWDLPFGLTIDGRYNLGLSDINNDSSPGASSFKNQVIQVSVGYKLFKFGK